MPLNFFQRILRNIRCIYRCISEHRASPCCACCPLQMRLTPTVPAWPLCRPALCGEAALADSQALTSNTKRHHQNIHTPPHTTTLYHTISKQNPRPFHLPLHHSLNLTRQRLVRCRSSLLSNVNCPSTHSRRWPHRNRPGQLWRPLNPLVPLSNSPADQHSCSGFCLAIDPIVDKPVLYQLLFPSVPYMARALLPKANLAMLWYPINSLIITLPAATQ